MDKQTVTYTSYNTTPTQGNVAFFRGRISRHAHCANGYVDPEYLYATSRWEYTSFNRLAVSVRHPALNSFLLSPLDRECELLRPDDEARLDLLQLRLSGTEAQSETLQDARRGEEQHLSSVRLADTVPGPQPERRDPLTMTRPVRTEEALRSEHLRIAPELRVVHHTVQVGEHAAVGRDVVAPELRGAESRRVLHHGKHRRQTHRLLNDGLDVRQRRHVVDGWSAVMSDVFFNLRCGALLRVRVLHQGQDHPLHNGAGRVHSGPEQIAQQNPQVVIGEFVRWGGTSLSSQERLRQISWRFVVIYVIQRSFMFGDLRIEEVDQLQDVLVQFLEAGELRRHVTQPWEQLQVKIARD